MNISTVFRSVFSACHHQFLLLSRCVRRKISIIFLPLSNLRRWNECAGCSSIHLGPSINNVIHFLKFLTPPSPLSPILLNRLYGVMSPFGRPPSSQVTSFMDDPKVRLFLPQTLLMIKKTEENQPYHYHCALVYNVKKRLSFGRWSI